MTSIESFVKYCHRIYVFFFYPSYCVDRRTPHRRIPARHVVIDPDEEYDNVGNDRGPVDNVHDGGDAE